MPAHFYNLDGQRARIALMAIHEGNGIDEAIEIALSYQQEAARLDRVISRLRKD